MRTTPASKRARRPRAELLRSGWIVDPLANLLAGLVVALALIPEVISFSVIAGIDPRVGLYASFSIAVIIAFAGGRPAMISAAAGSMALVTVDLIRDHGVEYLFAATILTGILQLGMGALGVGRLMRFIPRSVMVGFVNALAILIFWAQLPNVVGEATAVYVMVAVGLVIIYVFPRVTIAVPAPLVAIGVLTIGAVVLGIEVPTVGDMGALPSSLPAFAIPQVPWSLATLRIILPVSATLAVVGLLETLLTAQLIDDMTDTRSDKDRESRGQGIANVATGFLGGIAGCAMIGQSMINLRSGGRTRLSTLATGGFLLFLIVVAKPVLAAIPMAALVAVMIVVALATFDWSSVRPSAIGRHPRSETTVMVVTVAVVVATDNLAAGVIVGVLLSAVLFARRVAHLVEVVAVAVGDGTSLVYVVTGQLFFASTNGLLHAFDYDHPSPTVVIDLTRAHLWDSTAVANLDAIVSKFERRGTQATLVGLNDHSAALHGRLTGRLSASH